jgi:hypothetical protein
MRESSNLPTAFQNVPKETARRARRGRFVLLGFLIWTVFVGFALSRLLANSEPTVWVIHDERSPKSQQQARAMFRADVALHRIYPWIFFGPYVALLASYFPLERGRLRFSLPVNLAACAAFATACHFVNARMSLKTTNIVWVGNETISDGATGIRKTNITQIEVGGGGGVVAGGSYSEQVVRAFRFTNGANADQSNIIGIVGKHDFSDSHFTNLLAQLPPGIRAPLPPSGLPGLNFWPTFLDLLMFGATIGLTHSVHFYRRFRERERSALVLESNLANARLSALRAQLHPHFLFNSLNAIATLLRRDPRLAEAMLMSLSDLLRLALSQADRQEIPLREELNFIRRYLEIQQTRFGDRLRVEQDIEPTALDCLVPTLLLQPLVENAIRHGIEPTENAGLLRLTGQRDNGKLVLTVEDNGVGLATTRIELPETKPVDIAATTMLGPTETPISACPTVVRSNGNGIGLANLRERLETLYGTSQKLDLNSRSGGGVIVRVEIPWRPGGSLEMPAISTNS